MSDVRPDPPGTSAPTRSDAAPTPFVGFRALVVDDEAALAGLIGSYLERDGFEVSLSDDGSAAVQQARTFDPDVIVLDLGLPGLDGLDVCRQVRRFSDAYVVMLTARTDEEDTLAGLSAGADDYVTKPFSPRELVARVQAMLRRPRTRSGDTGHSGTPLRSFGSLTVDVDGRDVWVDGVAVALTRTEFDLLAALCARPHLPWSRRELIEQVWGATWVGDEHLVDVHIGHLRRKLGDDVTQTRFIRTVRGIGYRIQPAP